MLNSMQKAVLHKGHYLKTTYKYDEKIFGIQKKYKGIVQLYGRLAL